MKNKDKRPNPDRKRKPRDMTKVQCFNRHKYGHFAANCPKRKRKWKQHASVADVEDDQPQRKAKESQLDEMFKGIRKEYYLIFAFSGSITNSSEIWLVDNGASRHMTSYRSSLTDLTKDSSIHVELGGDAKYAMKGVGCTSL